MMMTALACCLALVLAAALFCGLPVDAFAPSPGLNRRAPSMSPLFGSHQMDAFNYDRRMVFEHASPALDVRQRWTSKSLEYYSKVMREERRRNEGQIKAEVVESETYRESFATLAKKHYFALRKIKDGKPEHAELIYRRIINELRTDDCDHAKLAITTLLLALHIQRTGDWKKTRSVFLNFFRIVTAEEARHGPEHQCACTAKVLCAYALFEMKRGNSFKSLDIVLRAVKLDPTLEPVLNWKQFRDAMTRRRQQQRQERMKENLIASKTVRP
jgi:hypothetical protein